MDRVLFVDQTSALGGAELSLCDILRLRGYRDRVVIFQHGPLERLLRDAGMEVQVSELTDQASSVSKSSGLFAGLRSARSLRTQIQCVRRAAAGYDLLYANTAKAFIVAAIAGWRSRKPVIYHVRDILSRDHFSNFNRRLIIRLSRFVAADLIANSQATADAFIAAGGNRQKVHVIYNGIEAAPFDAARLHADQHRANIRAQLSLGAEPLIGVFGRLAEWKGQHVAIQAMTQLPEMRLLIVGSPLFGEDAYAASLKKLARDLGVESRVIFVEFRRDLPEWMQACDVIVHCSVSPEPFGRVLVEAMLAGRPLVAARAGGALEIVEDGNTGLLTTPGDAPALANAIRRLIDNPALRQRLVTQALTEAKRRFDVVARVDEINQLIAQVAAEKVGGG
jgi:glycosyltransferase involved in cell wall biosynthesis